MSVKEPAERAAHHGYEPHSFEARWQKRWENERLYRAEIDARKPKFYLLEFFPYPSGDGLSVGHSKNYVPCDAFSRFMRMRGYSVLHPMGWDAFGLPAENEAILHQMHPRKNTAKNVRNYKRQMNLQALSYDWSREINASDPAYYRWTQWLFLLMYKRGLAYRQTASQWWCPRCQTILANEQVENGYCWRHTDQLVERKELDQWYFRITNYAEELLHGLEGLNWPDPILAMQRNWIGRSQGAEIQFKAEAADGSDVTIPVFTTRPDTVFGATFLVLSPEHPQVSRLTTEEQRGRVTQYQQVASRESEITRLSMEREKTGVNTGSLAVNPFTQERIPIWIADYVLVTYGTGAIMAVPAHDQRDFEFARKYHLPIRTVVREHGGIDAERDAFETDPQGAYSGEGWMACSGEFSGLDTQAGRKAIIASLESRGIGQGTTTYRMRDWLVSRQRYWGAPIPIVYCDQCEIVPVPEDKLPVLLPRMESYQPAGDGRSPLAASAEFVNTICPECGGPARRETDTLDTFVDSSWYYLRFTSPHDQNAAFDRAAVDYWAPIDLYVGGAEHAVMHLLYFRFVARVLNDAGLIGFREPALTLRNQGQMHAADGMRMSKSRGNVTTPDSVVAAYSADALRAYLMFMGPFDADADWSETGINGVWRWLNRVWLLACPGSSPRDGGSRDEAAATISTAEASVVAAMHRTVKKVGEDLQSFRFNTAVSALMEFTNLLQRERSLIEGTAKATRVPQPAPTQIPVEIEPESRNPNPGTRNQKPEALCPQYSAWHDSIDNLLRMMAPLTPYIAEELWHRRGNTGSIHEEPWPSFDATLAADASVTIMVQVNGKLRDSMELPAGSDQSSVETAAHASATLARWLQGETVRRIVFVPDRLVNFVTY